MAAGLPCIAFQGSGGSPEMIDGCGLTVPFGDTRQMSQAVERLARNADLRVRLGASAREMVKTRWCFEDYFDFLCKLTLPGKDTPSAGRQTRGSTNERPKRVVVPLDAWRRSPRDIEAEFLVAQLNDNGYAAELVFTRGRFGGSPRSRIAPPSVPFRYLQPDAAQFRDGLWRTTAGNVWKELRIYLKSIEPCVVISGFDELAAANLGTLSSQIGAVAIIRNEADVEALARSPDGFDQVIATSKAAAGAFRDRFPAASDRLSIVPPAIPCRAEKERRRRTKGGPEDGISAFCVVDSIRNPSHVSSILRIRSRLEDEGIELKLLAFDAGGSSRPADDPYLLSPEGDADLFIRPLDREGISALLRASDICLFLSDRDTTMPWLSWAMAEGSVPLCFDGGTELVEHEKTGYLFDFGDFGAVSSAIRALAEDRARLRLLASAAQESAARTGMREADWAARHAAVLDQVFAGLDAGGRLRQLACRSFEGAARAAAATGLPMEGDLWSRELV